MSTTIRRSIVGSVPIAERPQRGAGHPDPSWRGLYMAGGISVLLYILTALVVPGVMFIPNVYERGMDGAALLTFIGENQLWWIVLQTLTLGVGSFFAIVAFIALFVALKDVSKSYAAIGASVVITCQILFVAYYPLTLGIAYLGERYGTAAAEQRASLEAAAIGLMAVIDAFNPLYESALAIGVLFLSLAMLRGVFHRAIAYLGFATAASAFIALGLWPIVSIGYLWWWLFLIAWLIVIGWRLYKLGRA